MVRVDVDDRETFVAALLRLPGGVRKQLGRVEFLDRHPAEIVGLGFHGYPRKCLAGNHVQFIAAPQHLK
jgi:hypothetical protein